MTHLGEASDPSGIPPSDPPPTDRPSDRLFTVKDAAVILGISPEAVRARLKRGTLDRETGEDGTVYVRLDVDLSGPGHDRAADGMGNRTDGTTGGMPDGLGGTERRGDGERLDDLREEVAFLREELRREREARVEEKRRHDTIVLQLAHRIPELETPRNERESPERASEGAGSGDAPEAQEPPQRRSWWKRFFGFE
jgi:hypothetical protein